MTPNLDQERVERAAEAIYREFENSPKVARLQMNGVMADELARAAITAYLGDTHVDVSRGDLEYIASESSQSLIRDRARSYLSPTPAGKER